MSGTRSSSTPAGPARAIPAVLARLAPPVDWLRPKTLLVLATAVVLLLAGWFWLRDSSLVGVSKVEVTGVSGAETASIRAALDEAARSMTTLHVRQDALDTAVAPFTLVKRVEAETDFPHTLRLHVVTNVAVGAVVVGGGRIPVTSDGTLLRDVKAPAKLPTIPMRMTPGGTRVTEPAALAAVAALAAAPRSLGNRVESVVTTQAQGLSIQLAHGPLLVFGRVERFGAKWAAAAAVLADPEAAGARTIDVTVPERPAVVGLPEGAPADGESDIPTPPSDFTGADPATADPLVPDPAASAPAAEPTTAIP